MVSSQTLRIIELRVGWSAGRIRTAQTRKILVTTLARAEVLAASSVIMSSTPHREMLDGNEIRDV